MAHRFKIIALVVLTLLAGCGRGAKVCAVCQRDECVGLTFEVVLKNGAVVEVCCPRCGLSYVATAKDAVRSMWATDFATGKKIDATKASYVEGSDFSHCALHELRRDGYGCCYVKGYDRCQPSLVGFAETAAAQEFQKQHGGQIVMFEKLAER